jgi:hypothetical protein
LACEEAELQRAARLLRAAEALAGTTGAHLVPGQQAMQERARQLLGNAASLAVDEARAEGRAMSFQDVVSLVLGLVSFLILTLPIVLI